MALKGIKAIKDCVEVFFSDNNWDLNSRMAPDFCYLHDSNTVCWTLVASKLRCDEFAEFFEQMGCAVKADIFIYSLLHEVGHAFTIEELSDMDWNYSQDRKASGELSMEEYLRLPDELAATRWAVEYLNTHIDLVERFYRELQTAIMNMYKLNHIEIKNT